MFDPISWALTYILDKTGDKFINHLTSGELSSRLEETVRSWADNLDAERWVDPDAIFNERDPEPGPARKILSERLIDSKLPSSAEWEAALFERWLKVRDSRGEHQPFFNLSQSEATIELRTLAERLVTVCRSDERMYRESVIGLAERIEAWRQSFRDYRSERDAKILVRSIEAPMRWDSSYKIEFHTFYGGEDVVMIDRFKVKVASVMDVHRVAVKTPGAPAPDEHLFSVHLAPMCGEYEMQSSGPRRFMLSAGREGRVDLFRLTVTAHPGYAYLVNISATQVRFSGSETTTIASPDFWLTFEG